MPLVLKDRVKETSTTTGTGTLTLAGAATGFQSFSVIGDGNTTYYAIVDSAAGDWEVGLGTYTASGTTLSRDTILESSNSGSAVNFGAGAKDVFVTYPAEQAVTEGGVPALIDAHLNTSTATTNQVLSWTGSDYDWVTPLATSGGITTVAVVASLPGSPDANTLYIVTG
jgi:hypothetical protein